MVSPAEVGNEDQAAVDLFEFLRLVAIAAARGRLTRMQAAVATLTALDSNGTTGTGVVVNAGRTAVELGISERQVWRHFSALDQVGWFIQTTRPTKGERGSRGRRARYRCGRPTIDLGLISAPSILDRVTDSSAETSDDKPSIRVTDPRGELSDDESLTPEPSDSFDPHRLTVSAEPSDIAEREIGTLPTSGGSTSDGPTSAVVAAGAQPPDRARDDQPARDESVVAKAKAELDRLRLQWKGAAS